MATVTTAQGAVRGGLAKTETGFEYYEFMSIPYAKPPVADLRFKSPQSPEPWEDVRDATSSSPDNISMQVDPATGAVAGSEDCLYLNVYTPTVADTDADPLPVIVYIHGGGFVYVNGIIKDQHNPDLLITHNVVIVTINYRLGIFGFLSLDIPEAAGNMGLKDQVKALEWIQSNIAQFGGDKNNVTIGGISAGSASVEYLLLSPLAKGLFHKAFLQSGSSLNHWAINFENDKLILKYLEHSNYKGNIADIKSVYDYFMKVPAEILTKNAFEFSQTVTNRLFFGFVPCIETDFGNAESFLTVEPYVLLKEGRFNRVPILRGFCDREGYLTNSMRPYAVKELLNNKKFLDHWSYTIDDADVIKYNTELETVYIAPVEPDADADKFAVDFFGDIDFSAGVWISTKLLSRQNLPIYFYKFSYDGEINFCKRVFGIFRKGAAHGDDTTYLFNIPEFVKRVNLSDNLIRNRMTEMWTNFAKFGNPTPSTSALVPVIWPRFTEHDPQYLDIDEPLTIMKDYEPNKMKIIAEIYDKYRR